MKIHFITTGGTIDKVYFDAKSEYEIGSPQVAEVLEGANVAFEFEIEPVLARAVRSRCERYVTVPPRLVTHTCGNRCALWHTELTWASSRLTAGGRLRLAGIFDGSGRGRPDRNRKLRTPAARHRLSRHSLYQERV